MFRLLEIDITFSLFGVAENKFAAARLEPSGGMRQFFSFTTLKQIRVICNHPINT
jgi:hypothetical protein